MIDIKLDYLRQLNLFLNQTQDLLDFLSNTTDDNEVDFTLCECKNEIEKIKFKIYNITLKVLKQ
jgi:hypothetical protein